MHRSGRLNRGIQKLPNYAVAWPFRSVGAHCAPVMDRVQDVLPLFQYVRHLTSLRA